MLMLRGPEYAHSKQKRISDLLLVQTVRPARAAARVVIRHELEKYGVDASLVLAQPRIGKNGEVFMMEKLRTLRPEDNETPISPVTDFMRRIGGDELEQLEAIRRGQMSFVGHRCLLPAEHVAVYERAEDPKLVDRHRKLVMPTPPGNISSWGIRSHLGHIEGINQADLRLELDIQDVMDGSIPYDLQLTLHVLRLAVANKFTHGNIRLDEATR